MSNEENLLRYIAAGGKLDAPENASPRYRGELMRLIAVFVDSEMTEDDLGFEFPGDRQLGKHRVYGLGPELTLPIATSKTLIGFVNLRYFWELGARSTLEGNTFTFTLNFPIPSISLG